MHRERKNCRARKSEVDRHNEQYLRKKKFNKRWGWAIAQLELIKVFVLEKFK